MASAIDGADEAYAALEDYQRRGYRAGIVASTGRYRLWYRREDGGYGWHGETWPMATTPETVYTQRRRDVARAERRALALGLALGLAAAFMVTMWLNGWDVVPNAYGWSMWNGAADMLWRIVREGLGSRGC